MNNLRTRANKVVSDDPFKYGNNPKKGVSATNFYGLLSSIPLFFVVSLIFYLIACVQYELFLKQDGEVTQLSNTLNKIIDKKHKCFDDEEEIECPKETNTTHRSGKSIIDGSSVDQIQIGMKLVPNMDQHNFLLKRMQLVGGADSNYNGRESDIDYDMKAMGDPNEFPKFYEWNGAQHMSFPSINFDANQVPYGDSVVMCMGVSWTPMEKRNQYDRYLNIRNLPECDEAMSGRSQWEEDYPTHGIDFNIWKQDQ